MGVSAAYVRLGERHEDGAFPIRPNSHPPSPASVPFRILKTTRRLSLSSQTVTNVHGVKWMEELKAMCDLAEAKLASNGKELQRPKHDRSPNTDILPKLHEGDLYLCAESLEALEGALGGVCDAVDAVFRPQGAKRAFVAIRPPGHHCSASYPSGFCWINNVHVGIMHGILSHGLTHAAIIDFDLHHGDGSQAIAWEHNARGAKLGKNAAGWKKTSIGYFSLHDINSYPCEEGDSDKVRNASICIDNAHGQSIWNVHLQPWKTEAEFFDLYESKYSILLDKTRSYLRSQTERLRAAGQNARAAIFLSAGFDASEWEGAGMQRHNVNVPTSFYARLTRDVVRIASEDGTGVDGRVISVLEGGYSDRALCSGVLSHICGLTGEEPVLNEPGLNGLGYEMGQRMGAVRGRKDSSASERGSRRYEPAWWSAAALESLENVQVATPLEPRKPRSTTTATYSSPTHSSSAKVVTPKVRRSTSGLSPNGLTFSRAPTPPPPEVPWTVATHELSKLLIPTGRQTDSCKHEDLNTEATRARRDRQSVAVSIVQADRPPTRMALRERKAKPAASIDEEMEDDRKYRRKTVAGSAVLPSEKAGSHGGTPAGNKPPKQSGRRLSAASTIVSDNVEAVPPAPLSAPIRNKTRPSTSLTIRPESSVSVRVTSGNGINVKKTRAPAKKEATIRAPRAPKKITTSTDNGASARTSPLSATPVSVSPEPSPTLKPTSDIDSLANEMKKIKITLVTKAQCAAREQERLAREKLAQANTISFATSIEENKPFLQPEQQPGVPSSPAGATMTPMSSPPAMGPPEKPELVGPSPEPSPGPRFLVEQSPVDLLPTAATPALGRAPILPHKVSLPSSSPVGTTPSRRSTRSPTRSPARSPSRGDRLPQNADVFIPYQPEGPAPSPLPKEQQQSQPALQWLPPNTGTPTPLMRRADLPVFTATSTIPFAPPQARNSPSSPLKRIEDSIWEIPETPEK